MLREYLKFIVAIIVVISVCYLSIITSKLEILAGMAGGIVAYLFGIKTNKEEVKNEVKNE